MTFRLLFYESFFEARRQDKHLIFLLFLLFFLSPHTDELLMPIMMGVDDKQPSANEDKNDPSTTFNHVVCCGSRAISVSVGKLAKIYIAVINDKRIILFFFILRNVKNVKLRQLSTYSAESTFDFFFLLSPNWLFLLL
jgi:hypothetical protein